MNICTTLCTTQQIYYMQICCRKPPHCLKNRLQMVGYGYLCNETGLGKLLVFSLQFTFIICTLATRPLFLVNNKYFAYYIHIFMVIKLEVGISIHDVFPVTYWLTFQTPSSFLTGKLMMPPATELKSKESRITVMLLTLAKVLTDDFVAVCRHCISFTYKSYVCILVLAHSHHRRGTHH